MSYLITPDTHDNAPIQMTGQFKVNRAQVFIESFQEDLDGNTFRHRREAFSHLAADGEAFVTYTFPNEESYARFFEKFFPTYDLDSAFEAEEVETYEKILAEKLADCEFPGVRGKRAAFVDMANLTILVGTSVIYNERHYTANFKDPLIEAMVQAAIEPETVTVTVNAKPGVDLQEILAVAQALRQRAKPKFVDAVFDRSQVVDEDLMALAQRLEAQVVAAGGSLESEKVQVREIADELVQTIQESTRELRERVERGIDTLRDFWKKH